MGLDMKRTRGLRVKAMGLYSQSSQPRPHDCPFGLLPARGADSLSRRIIKIPVFSAHRAPSSLFSLLFLASDSPCSLHSSSRRPTLWTLSRSSESFNFHPIQKGATFGKRFVIRRACRDAATARRSIFCSREISAHVGTGSMPPRSFISTLALHFSFRRSTKPRRARSKFLVCWGPT